MRPRHPCLACEHATLSECARAAEERGVQVPGACLHCGCACQSSVVRAGSHAEGAHVPEHGAPSVPRPSGHPGRDLPPSNAS